MAGQTEADTRPMDDAGSAGESKQADEATTGGAVPERRDDEAQPRATGPAKDEAKSSDTGVIEYRLKRLESQVAKMRKVFLDHTHETLGDQPPPTASSGEASATTPEPDAIKAEVAEKPPTQSKEREEKRKEATAQYFTRIHRHKRRTRTGADD